MLFNKEVKEEISLVIAKLRGGKSVTFKLVAAALMGLLAALFQSAGGVIPGIGMLISPFSSAPIIISMFIGSSYGVLSYPLTIFLLLIIQPSEFIIFPFTTGLMALGIGVSFILYNRLWIVIGFSGLFLFAGISFLLYGVQFPILGPLLFQCNGWNLIIIYFFSLVYCWLWTYLVIKMLPKFVKN